MHKNTLEISFENTISMPEEMLSWEMLFNQHFQNNNMLQMVIFDAQF